MTNKSKATGREWENRIVKYLQEHGYPDADRGVQHGSLDRGDCIGVPFVVEAKAERAISLAQYLKEVRVETRNAGKEIGVAWVKAPRKGIQDSYIVMDPETFLVLIASYETTMLMSVS